eukprot:c25146_g1_i3 orf=288-1772(+)
MEAVDHLSRDGNGNVYGKTIGAWSNRARLANGKSFHKAAAVAAAWDDSADGSETVISNGSSGVFTPSMDADLADAESCMSSLSPSSAEPSQLLLKVHVMEALISGVFSTVSSLKKAYVHLQSAHAPYDADKLQLADRAVIAELKKFSELKQSYKERLVIVGSCDVQGKDFETHEESKQELDLSYEGIINNFHSEIQAKDMVIESLKDTLAQTTLKKEKLERRVKRLEQKVSRESFVNFPYNDASPSPQLLESVVLGASEASRSFAKLLMSLMKMARWDLDAAANSIEPGISYMRSTHKKYVFESYIFHRMLNDFESGTFCITPAGGLPSVCKSKEQCFKEFQEMRAMNPHESIVSKPESFFAKYCLKKFLDLIHPKMEESFFGNLEHRQQISSGIHPQSQFYQNFLKLAKAMWLLHQLAFSFEPNARIFQVKRNTEFSPLYMESIVRSPEIDMGSHSEAPKVAFTIMPGFRVENTIIKCQVYIIAPRLDESRQV